MKHYSFIRSLFVAIFACFAVSTMAGDLNPFAFKLSSDLVGDVFYVNYYLNAPATSVKVTITLPNDQKVVYDCTDSLNTQGTNRVKGVYELKISLREYINNIPEFRGRTNLPWSVDVMGGNPAAYPTDAERKNGAVLNAIAAKEYAILRPYSVDIDCDPYSDNFGVVYMVDAARPKAEDKRIYFGGNAVNYADGLYIFDPAFQFMPAAKANYDFLNPMSSTTGTYSINARSDEKGISAFHNRAGQNKHLFHKVRISHDENHDTRLFVTYCSQEGPILTEGKTDRFTYISTLNSWFKQIIASKPTGTVTRNASDSCIYNGSTFVAGPNVAFDVYDNGLAADLELLMVSRYHKGWSTTENTYNIGRQDFRADKYKLGNWTWGDIWHKAPTTTGVFDKNSDLAGPNTWYKNTNPGGTPAVGFVNAHTGANVEYDQHGGFWLCYYRANHSEMASLVHFKKNGDVNFIEYWANRQNGAVRYDKDNSRLALSGGRFTTRWTTDKRSKHSGLTTRVNGTTTEYGHPAATGDAVTIYTINQANLNTQLIDNNTKESSLAHRNSMFTDSVYINGLPDCPNDMAWDYADNIYFAFGETAQFMAYALPHAGKTVSTPCKTDYYFNTPTQSVKVQITPNKSCGNVVDHACPQMTQYWRNAEPNTFDYYYLADDADGDNTDVTKVKFQLEALPAAGYRFYTWDNVVQDKALNSVTTVQYVSTYAKTNNDEKGRTAHFGIDVWETKSITQTNEQMTFRGVFVQRELDTESYSTICLPFHLESLTGTPYEGASVLEFNSATPSTADGDNRISLNFKEVEFGTGKGMRAGVPYLIKVATAIASGEEKIFNNVTCPVIGTEGQSVKKGDVTFHGLLNPTTFTKEQVKDKLFLTADNRLVSLYGQNSFSINGLRGFFTVKEGAKNVEYMLNLPEKVVTSTPTVNMADTLQVTKYLWNGQIYIQRGNAVYDLSGVRVK